MKNDNSPDSNYFKYKIKYVELKNNILPYEKTINYHDKNDKKIQITLKMLSPSELRSELGKPSMNNHQRMRLGKSVGYNSTLDTLNNKGTYKASDNINSILYGVALYYENDENPYVYVTLRIIPEYRICLPMGIQNNFNLIDQGIKIPRASFILHSFWASFVKEKYPNIEYSIVQPVDGMLHLFLTHFKFNNNNWIPISVGFLGDIEQFLDNGDSYKNANIEKYKFYLQEQIQNKEEHLEKKNKRIDSKKNIALEDLKKNQDEINLYYDEDIKNKPNDTEDLELARIDELLNEQKSYNNKIKSLESKIDKIKNRIKNYNDILNSEPKILEELNRLKKSKTYKKIEPRISNNGLLIPNPLEVNKKENKAILSFSNEQKIFNYKDFFRSIPTPNGINNYGDYFSNIFWNSATLIIIRVDDLNSKWNEY